MKFRVLPFLFIILLFTSCVEKIVTITGEKTTPPEYSIDRKDLTSRISGIIPAEKISIRSGNTKNSGEEAFNFLMIEIVSPETFPSSGFTFSNQADEITTIVKEGIKNINDYQKLNIEVRNTIEENNTEHSRTYKKEIDL